MNNTYGTTNAACRPHQIFSSGNVVVKAAFRSCLTIAEYNRLWDKTAATERAAVLVCSWRRGEPIIHGFSDTAMGAWKMAQACTVGTKYKDDELEICEKIQGETLAWRGPSGRVVTVEHHREIDN